MDATNREYLRRLIVKVVLVFVVSAGFTVWVLLTPPGLIGKLDAIGYAFCHRIADRSYFLQYNPDATLQPLYGHVHGYPDRFRLSPSG